MSDYSTEFIADQFEYMSQKAGTVRSPYQQKTVIRTDLLKTANGRYGICFCIPAGCPISVASSKGFDIDTKEDGDQTEVQVVQASEDDPMMFFTFIADLLALNARHIEGGVEAQAEALLERIAAWQTFMKTSRHGLSEAAEIGLFGELCFLEGFLMAGAKISTLNKIWTGPKHGAKDFTFGNGAAVEVKTSLCDAPFTAKVDSIDQLDTSEYPDLVVAAVKLSEDEKGRTLADLCDAVDELLYLESAKASFKNLVMGMGIDVENPPRPFRRFEKDWIYVYRADALPRILRSTVPGVLDCVYDINLSDPSGEPLQNIELQDIEALYEQYKQLELKENE